MRKELNELLRRRGSLLLMWVLLAVTLASPVGDAHPHIGAVLALVVVCSILVGARFAGNKRIVRMVAVPLSGAWMIARLLEEFGNGQHPYNHLAHVFGLALSCTILWALFHRLGRTSQVTSSVIAEAFISYLIIATAFSQLYWILNELVADAFNPKILPSEGTTFLYFSMTTLSSLGYGEIAPVNPFVRLVAALESMTGIFFVAVVVARLVSSYRPKEDRT
jgi:Ion channel